MVETSNMPPSSLHSTILDWLAGRKSHYSRLQMYPFWAKDFLTDPRVIHNVGRTLKQVAHREKFLGEAHLEQAIALQPRLSLSFDIERDVPVQPFESSQSATARPFLEEFNRRTQNTGLKATFFVQGEMIPDFAPVLHQLLASGHEIGLHGFTHELWGCTNWITRRPPITLAEREKRLNKAISNFLTAGLPRPLAFRAPNFTIDADTFRLLKAYGFKVDSSMPTQRGNLYHLEQPAGLHEVPVSCSPLPQQIVFSQRLKLKTAVHFAQFNFDCYIKQPLTHLSQTVENLLKFQVSQNIAPHLVMYAHNWEFYRDSNSQLEPVSTAFEALIQNSLNLLKAYAMVSATVSELAQQLYKDN